MPKQLHTSLVLLLCLLATGCAGTVKSLGEISKLHAALVKEFPDGEVGVNLNNDVTLIITFVNSSVNNKQATERAAQAQQAATFVVQHYPSIKHIESIWVGFVRQETRFVFFHYSEGLEFFGFDSAGTPVRQPDAEPGDGQYTSAIYSTQLKQTDVVIRNMQLEGDAENGMALLPHFTVPGNVTKAEPSTKLPLEVRFDLASSSDKSLFPGAPKITFLVDQKIVYETTDQFSTSKFGDKFSETLSLPLSYPVFRRLTSGKSLNLRIGDKEYPFSSEQVEGLAEMRAYVKE